MPAMDFPNSPINGQTTTDGRYYFDSSVGSTGAWRSTPLPVGGLPAGSIMAWGTNTPPANWLLADGSAISRSVYSSLFAVIGTQYGAGDGTTTFNLPDLRGRVPVGKNGGTFGTLGATGGAETHTLTTAQMPSHTHVQDAHTHTIRSNDGGNGPIAINKATGGSQYYNFAAAGVTNNTSVVYNESVAATNQNTGGGQAHNILQPYQVVNYIIKFSAGWTAGDSELATRLGVVETANATTNKSGLVPIIPTSVVAISSGTATVGTNGLVTFTGVGGVILNGVFSSAYKNYRVLVNHEASMNMNVGVRFGTNGTRETGAGYQLMGGYATQAGGFSAWTGQNQTYIQTGSTDAVPGSTTLSADVLNPFVSSRRSVLNFQSSGWSGTYRGVFGSGLDVNETSRTDISYEPTGGNITGTIQVYGYR